MSGENESALIRRPSSALENATPGAKRVLVLMVSETLAIAQQRQTFSPILISEAQLEKWRHLGLDHGGASFDENTYQEVKPHFRQTWERFKGADRLLIDYFRFIFKQFGVQIRPYLKRFVLELQAELKAAKNELQADGETHLPYESKNSLRTNSSSDVE